MSISASASSLVEPRPLSPSAANLFTCTFCFSLSPGPPQVLGRSARLTCGRCCAILLDLSICWVCGELIFRGDECVSFGWCFWHRACYGCLLCGSKIIYRGVKVQSLFSAAATAGKKGREVTEAPVCAACMVEAEVDGVGDETMVKKGLRRVERFDGGVTKKRWEEKEKQRKRKMMGVDGTWSEDDGRESVLWVNLFDPINGHSFKPSSLKPIPWFRTSIPPLAFRGQDSVEAQRASEPATPRPETPTIRLPPTPDSKELPYFPSSVDASAVYFKRQSAIVREEPLRYPSSRLKKKMRGSETICSAYMTPPEFPEHTPTGTSQPKEVPSQLDDEAAAHIISKLNHMKHEKSQSSEYIDEYRPILKQTDWTRTEIPLPPRMRRSTVLTSATAPALTRDTASASTLPPSRSSISMASLERNDSGSRSRSSKEGGKMRSVGAELRKFFTGR